MTAPEPADMLWWGWGTEAGHAPLSEELRALVEQVLGMTRRDTPAVGLDTMRVPPVALGAAALAALTAAVGPAHVLTEPQARLLHSGGKSTTDLLRRRAGEAASVPDAVILPGGHEEVLAVLEACTAHAVAVIPFGGGTSVVGGVEPRRDGLSGCIALDLRRLDRLLEVDGESLIAIFEAGVRAPRAEALLAAHGLTLGHQPQSFEHTSLGGFAATRSAGQASAGYGRFDELVEGLVVATPIGAIELGRAPASAAGPDLRQLFLGSEGTLGVITRLRLRVRPLPAVRVFEGWSLPDFSAGVAALRRLAQTDGALPTVLRLSDPAETAITAAIAGEPTPAGCLAITGYEGEAVAVTARRLAAAAVLSGAGATPLGPGAGDSWQRTRYQGPYLRDALLGIGVLVETLETATSWSGLERLHATLGAVLSEALTAGGTPGLVLCHVSHVYATGASLYFTVVATQAADPLTQWATVKRAAGAAVAAAGATITHHHGVGLDHRDWMAQEIGELGVEILRAVKARLDPTGILNPGKLIPPRSGLPSADG
ncbi:MAG TPA: FAD-binding oxidoreductase [Candidatus Dormibacteraeota bacterium]